MPTNATPTSDIAEEVSHFIVKASNVIGRMPYGGTAQIEPLDGIHSLADVLYAMEKLRAYLVDHGAQVNANEVELMQLRRDVAAVRRVFGTEGS